MEFIGGEGLLKWVQDFSARATNKPELYRRAGEEYVSHENPRIFNERGPGWAPPKYRRGRPLYDRGILQASVTFRVGSDLVIGTEDIRGGVHQRGKTIVPGPGKKFLAIPLSPPLTPTEARAGNPRSYVGAFVLMKGPEGPGIYRASRSGAAVNIRSRKTSYRNAGSGRGIERIFALVRSVEVHARPFMKLTERFLGRVKAIWVGMVKE